MEISEALWVLASAVVLAFVVVIAFSIVFHSHSLAEEIWKRNMNTTIVLTKYYGEGLEIVSLVPYNGSFVHRGVGG